MKALLLALWRYRYFILSSIKVDFRQRFVRSRLGGLWLIVHPLVQAAIFALVLGQLLSGRLPEASDNPLAYAIYLLAGTLAWNLFTEVITRCLTVFIENGNLLKKLVFPKICLPAIVSGSAMVNNLLLFLAILLVFAAMGYVPGVRVLYVPVLMVITLALSLGVGLILGTLNVFIRDIGQAVPIALQLGFWFTPIVYTPDIVPDAIQHLMRLNPMYWIVGAYQDAILYGDSLSWIPLGYIFLISLMLLGIAMVLFRRARHEIVDAL